MRTDGHYVFESSLSGFGSRLICVHCAYTLYLAHYRRKGDKSGRPRYARGRGIIVQHLHATHKPLLACSPNKHENHNPLYVPESSK